MTQSMPRVDESLFPWAKAVLYVELELESALPDAALACAAGSVVWLSRAASSAGVQRGTPLEVAEAALAAKRVEGRTLDVEAHATLRRVVHSFPSLLRGLPGVTCVHVADFGRARVALGQRTPEEACEVAAALHASLSQQLGVQACVGAGPNVLLAKLAAVAARQAGPGTTVCVAGPGDAASLLARTPLPRLLALMPDVAEQVNNASIASVASLQSLTVEELETCYGLSDAAAQQLAAALLGRWDCVIDGAEHTQMVVQHAVRCSDGPALRKLLRKLSAALVAKLLRRVPWCAEWPTRCDQSWEWQTHDGVEAAPLSHASRRAPLGPFPPHSDGEEAVTERLTQLAVGCIAESTPEGALLTRVCLHACAFQPLSHEPLLGAPAEALPEVDEPALVALSPSAGPSALPGEEEVPAPAPAPVPADEGPAPAPVPPLHTSALLRALAADPSASTAALEALRARRRHLLRLRSQQTEERRAGRREESAAGAPP